LEETTVILSIDTMKVIYIVCGCLGGAAVLTVLTLLLASFLAFRMIIKGKPGKSGKSIDNDEKLLTQVMGPDYEDWLKFVLDSTKEYENLEKTPVTVTTFDNLKLYGDFVAADTKSNKTVICMHGYRSNPKNEFSQMIPFLRKAGYNLLFVNHRAHGPSEGKYIGFGSLDHKDAIKWIEAVEELVPGGDIFLYGVSMGAATVMNACGLDNLPSSVKGAVQDCGFTSPWDVIAFQVNRLLRFSSFPLVNVINMFCKIFAKYSLKKPTTTESVSMSSVPILFIHGDNDLFVPTYMSEVNYRACTAPKRKLIVDNAGHAMSYYKNPSLYEETFLAFLEQCSGDSNQLTFEELLSSDYDADDEKDYEHIKDE